MTKSFGNDHGRNSEGSLYFPQECFIETIKTGCDIAVGNTMM